MSQKIFSKLIHLLPQIIASLFLTGFMVFAWTEPSQSPPRENTPAPLNVGNVGQTKIGGLILNTGGAPNGLIIDKGKVGIGTQNPQDQLHVEATNAARLRLKETNSWETVLESAWQNTFNIYNSGAVQFTIKGDKVGIGNQNPNEKLEVQGNVKISGEIKGLKAENVSSLPAAGTPGRMVFNTSDNKMYFSDGYSWRPLYGLLTQTFTSSGTFVVPAGGTTKVKVTLVGGGGGGGSGGCGQVGQTTSNWAAGGGGGGGAGEVKFQEVSGLTPGTTISIQVGGGGAGGVLSGSCPYGRSSYGGSGGDSGESSSFGSYVTAFGGSGGGGGGGASGYLSAWVTAPGGSGGNIGGESGQTSVNQQIGRGGSGGVGYFSYGDGGKGGDGVSGGISYGSSGDSGVVIVEW